MPVQFCIFLGYVQTHELKRHLNQSTSWKEAKLLKKTVLTEIRWEHKDYIGIFISSLLTYAQIKEKEAEVKKQLEFFSSKINLERHSSYLFAQPFLT